MGAGHSVLLIGRLHEVLELEVTFFVNELMELCCQLHDFEVSDAHLSQNFLQSVQLDHAGFVVFARQQRERVLHVSRVELGRIVQRENLLELSEGDFGCLLENLIKLLGLFVVRYEAHHLENGVETFSVQLLFV